MYIRSFLNMRTKQPGNVFNFSRFRKKNTLFTWISNHFLAKEFDDEFKDSLKPRKNAFSAVSLIKESWFVIVMMYFYLQKCQYSRYQNDLFSCLAWTGAMTPRPAGKLSHACGIMHGVINKGWLFCSIITVVMCIWGHIFALTPIP